MWLQFTPSLVVPSCGVECSRTVDWSTGVASWTVEVTEATHPDGDEERTLYSPTVFTDVPEPVVDALMMLAGEDEDDHARRPFEGTAEELFATVDALLNHPS